MLAILGPLLLQNPVTNGLERHPQLLVIDAEHCQQSFRCQIRGP